DVAEVLDVEEDVRAGAEEGDQRQAGERQADLAGVARGQPAERLRPAATRRAAGRLDARDLVPRAHGPRRPRWAANAASRIRRSSNASAGSSSRTRPPDMTMIRWATLSSSGSSEETSTIA